MDLDYIEPGNDDYLSLIPEIEAESIKYIYVSEKGGYVCLELELTEKTREAVLEADKALENNPCVISAMPNYIWNALGGENSPIITQVAGDVNGDGELSNTDIVEAARYIVGLTEFTDEQLSAADMDESGDVANADLVLLAKAAVA